MTALTPDEIEALAHWSSFGRPGSPVTERYIPEDFERERFKPFVAPASGVWPGVFDGTQTLLLLRGFPRGEMEDKWIVYSDDVTSGGASVHFHRSWTGAQIVQVDLQLTDTGSRIAKATWETDAAALKTPTEEFARSTFAEVCRWVLGMSAAD